MNILTFDIEKRQKVLCGRYNETTKTFHKTVKPNHYMRKYGGYGISSDAMEELKKLGCAWVVITAPKETLKTSFDLWYKQPDRSEGHGFQKFYLKEKMTVLNSD